MNEDIIDIHDTSYPADFELAKALQENRGHSAYLSESEGESEDEDDDDDGDEEGEDEGEGEGEGENGETVDQIARNPIRFEEWDILSPASTGTLFGQQTQQQQQQQQRLPWFPYETGGFDIVLDKGTFDAVSLSDEVVGESHAGNDPNQGKEGGGKTTTGKTIHKRICEKYPHIAKRLVRRGGYLIVTSCNWTEEELVRWFCGGGVGQAGGGDGQAGEGESGGGQAGEESGSDRLVVWTRLEYPRFRFGGREGQGVCTVCFRRV